MSTTRGYYLRPSPGDVLKLERLWRETPKDLNGVRQRFLANGVRRMSTATVLRCRPDDLPWPTANQRKRFRWPKLLRELNGPNPEWKADRAEWSRLNVRYPAVVVNPSRKTKAQIEAELMEPSATDPTPEQIRQMADAIRRSSGLPGLLEIDLR